MPDKSFTVYAHDEKQFHQMEKLPHCTFILHVLVDGAEKQASMDIAKNIINDPLKFPLYNKTVCKPNGYELKKNELNVWSGFKAQELDGPPNMEIVNVFINHIGEVWANDNDSVYKYMMSWLAQIIKKPYKQTGVAIMLQGGQGSGKTLPCDILQERVFGKNVAGTSSGLGSLPQRFNGTSMGKVLRIVNELSIVEPGSFTTAFDKMKSLITDRRVEVE